MRVRSEQLQQKLDALPQKPGVYLFKDKNGKIIYIGKAKILR
ncbi:MAG: excinuclease ABC, partial [Calditrichaeota bacterium]